MDPDPPSTIALTIGVPAWGRHLVDPYFYPIYDEAKRLDIAVAVHIANGSPDLVDRFKPRYDKMGGASGGQRSAG